MTADITTVVGQLSISGGKGRRKSPNEVAVGEPKAEGAPGAGKGDLFIVIEIQGSVAHRNALEQQLAQAIRDTYYLSRGSITASLRRAMQAGSDLLYDYNRQRSAEERAVGGVVVLVTNNEDAFVAQIGPAAFFAVMGDHIRRYPAKSAWLDEALGPAQDEEVSALGVAAVIEPGLHHLRISPQDKLVLADSRLAGQLPLRELVRAVDSGNVKTAITNLARIAQTQNGSAIVLEVIETKTTSIGPLKIATPKFSTPSSFSSLLHRYRGQPVSAQAVTQPVAAQTAVAEPPYPPPVVEPVPEAQTHASAVFTSTSIMQRPLQWLGALTHKLEPKIPGPEPVLDNEEIAP